MTVLKGIKPGVIATLPVTQESQHRILVSLRWDPQNLSEEQLINILQSGEKDIANAHGFALKINTNRLMEKRDMQERETDDPRYDIDLYCYAYDKNGQFKTVVDPSAWNAIDDAGKIYHSGDSFAGAGKFDDEQIYIELREAQEHYSNFFFVVESDCMHDFSAIKNSFARLSDSKTDETILHVDLSELPDAESFAFVFCHIWWDGENWKYQNISEFCDYEQDWPAYLKKFKHN